MKLRAVAAEIDDALDSKLNPGPPHVRNRMVLTLLVRELEATGKLLLADGVPTHLLPDGKTVTLTAGAEGYTAFISSCGLPPCDGWDKRLTEELLGRSLPKTRTLGLSHYDIREHVAYLNEWNGSFLRIGPDGKTTRHVNGEFGLLWETADEPHDTDLDIVNAYTGGALSWTDEDVLIKHILGVGVFSESTGVGRTHALNALLCFMLALALKARVKTIPIPFLNGPSGSRKSSLATGIGRVVSGAGLEFRVTSCPDSAKEVQNVLCNARGIVCLDEVQNARALGSLLKAYTTGAVIRIRILYTTSGEKVFIPDSVLFLTINDDAWMDEATTKRLLRIDMGQPTTDATGAGAWRADHYVMKDWVDGNLRERGWNELVCRVSAAMRLLTQAVAKGRADIRVRHRMSDFWGFVLSIAEQESPECLAQMEATLTAIDESQSVAVGNSDDLLPKMLEWLGSNPDCCKRWMPVHDVGDAVLSWWGLKTMGRGAGPEMRKILSSSFQLSRKLKESQLYVERLGLQTRENKKRKVKEFWFDPPVSEVSVGMRVQIGGTVVGAFAAVGERAGK
jgi:hypothetical protein